MVRRLEIMCSSLGLLSTEMRVCHHKAHWICRFALKRIHMWKISYWWSFVFFRASIICENAFDQVSNQAVELGEWGLPFTSHYIQCAFIIERFHYLQFAYNETVTHNRHQTEHFLHLQIFTKAKVTSNKMVHNKDISFRFSFSTLSYGVFF